MIVTLLHAEAKKTEGRAPQLRRKARNSVWQEATHNAVRENSTPPTGRPPSPLPSTSREIVYETPKHGFIPGIDDDDNDGTEEEQTEEENVGTVGGPPRGSRRFLDTQYGIRTDGEHLMIGVSPVFIDTDDNFTIKGTVFRGMEGL